MEKPDKKTWSMNTEDMETMLTFALLTQSVYLKMTHHLLPVLPITALVPCEKRCVLHANSRNKTSRKRIAEALEELCQNLLNTSTDAK